MKFAFTEIEGFADFRGRVDVTAETPAEVLAMIKRFRLGPPEADDRSGASAEVDAEVTRAMWLAETVKAGTLTHSLQSDKRPWFEVTGCVDNKFIAPYLNKLRRVTGCELPVLPDADLTPFHPDRLRHTYLADRIWSEFGSVCYRCFDNAEEWNGRSAAANAELYVARHVEEEFAFEPPTPEFLQSGNGHYYRNPDYATGKKQPLVPQAKAEWFLNWLFAWWEENRATAAQREIMARNLGISHRQWWNDCGGLHVADDAGPIDWDGKGRKARFVKWEEFAAMGAGK